MAEPVAELQPSSDPAPPRKHSGVMEALKAQKHYEVNISESADDRAIDPVPVGVNGVRMYIKRGEWVRVPEAFVEVLKNAVGDSFVAKQDERGMLKLIKRTVQSYPFSVRECAD